MNYNRSIYTRPRLKLNSLHSFHRYISAAKCKNINVVTQLVCLCNSAQSAPHTVLGCEAQCLKRSCCGRHFSALAPVSTYVAVESHTYSLTGSEQMQQQNGHPMFLVCEQGFHLQLQLDLTKPGFTKFLI